MKPEKKGSAKRQQHHASPSAAQTTSTGTPELPASSNASVQQQMPNAEKKALQQQQTQKQMFNELAVRNNFQVLIPNSSSNNFKFPKTLGLGTKPNLSSSGEWDCKRHPRTDRHNGLCVLLFVFIHTG